MSNRSAALKSLESMATESAPNVLSSPAGVSPLVQGARGASTPSIKKGIDTRYLAARQLVLWDGGRGEGQPAVAAALPLPRFVVRRAKTLAEVQSYVSRSKIEVVLVDLVEPEMLEGLAALKAADPDLEIVVLADRARIEALGPGEPDSLFEVLGRPFAPLELARKVELARERRYLRRAEQRRKRVEARMGAIVQAVPTGIISIDAEGVVHDWNQAATRIFGWSEAEAVGHVFWDLVGIDRKALTDHEGALNLARKFELSVRNRSGSTFPIDMSLVSVPLSERTMMCAIVEDRTLAKRLELELRQAQKLEAVGQLSAGLAHEINTPCQFIGDNVTFLDTALADLATLLPVYAQLAARAEAGTLDPELLAKLRQAEEDADLEYCLPRLPEALGRVSEGVRRIADIVRAMKSFAQADWSKGTSVHINELLENVLTVLGHEAQAVAEIERDFGEIAPLMGHGGDLHQAFFHLLRNAIDAVASRSPERAAAGKGAVRVVSRSDDSGITIQVSDTGCGIAPRIQGRIFEPFFTTKDVGRGTGQGLSVAWSVIVEQHGGRLTFDTREGEGTTFSAHLPWSRPKRGEL